MPELAQGLATVGDDLTMRDSILVGTGLGLFATCPFRQGEFVTYYQRQRIFEAQARRARGEDAYIVTLESMALTASAPTPCRPALGVPRPATMRAATPRCARA
jgi:hypothetical protein